MTEWCIVSVDEKIATKFEALDKISTVNRQIRDKILNVLIVISDEIPR